MMFVLGFLSGGLIGVVIMAVLIVGARADEAVGRALRDENK